MVTPACTKTFLLQLDRPLPYPFTCWYSFQDFWHTSRPCLSLQLSMLMPSAGPVQAGAHLETRGFTMGQWGRHNTPKPVKTVQMHTFYRRNQWSSLESQREPNLPQVRNCWSLSQRPESWMPHQGLRNPKAFPSLLSYSLQPWDPAPLRHLLSPARTPYFSLLSKDTEAPLSESSSPVRCQESILISQAFSIW